MRIVPGQPDGRRFYQLLTSAVAPRPIALASTIDENTQANLSPFSFFNCMGSNPATLVFSPLSRVRDATTKHTLDNVRRHPEVVINVVSYPMVHQTSLASCEYPLHVDEFRKAGFTPEASEMIRPWRVKESPVSFECRVTGIIDLGEAGGAGHLVCCEILVMHIQDRILDESGHIDPDRIDLVARMGRDYYCRASGDAVFVVPKPSTELGIGFDRLPPSVSHSEVLSGNDLARLASVTGIPSVDPAFDSARLTDILQYFGASPGEMERELHIYARELLREGRTADAWQVLLASAD